jgi:hypothetical protein
VTEPSGPHVERQRSSPRARVVTLVLLAVGTVVGFLALPWLTLDPIPWWGRVLFGLAVGAAAASAYALPLRRSVQVGPERLSAGRIRLPLDDVEEVEVEELSSWYDLDTDAPAWPRLDAWPSWFPRGVRIDLVTPEGLPYELWVASDTPEDLRAAILAGRDRRRGVPAGDLAPGEADVEGYRGPRGGSWPVVVGVVVLVWGLTAIATGPAVLTPWLVAAVVGALLAVPMLRRIEVGPRRIRSGTLELDPSRLRSVRFAGWGRRHPPFLHARSLPSDHRQGATLGPSTWLVCTLEPVGEAYTDRLAATYLVAMPRTVDLRAVFPDAAGVRLPRAAGDDAPR